MPLASDFRTVKCQATVFTRTIQFRAARIFARLVTEFAEIFDGDTVSLPEEHLPPQFPRIILKNASEELTLHASPLQLNISLDRDHIGEDETEQFIELAVNIILDYLKTNDASAGRTACVLHRVAGDDSPPLTLARHFCKDQWLQQPLDRPADLELHALKRFWMDEFEVNSWMRCKSGYLDKKLKVANPVRDVIITEQDVNIVSEAMDTEDLGPDAIRRFFQIVPERMYGILELYFPEVQP